MAGPGETEVPPAQPVHSVADPDKFSAYLFRCVPDLLEDSEEASTALRNAVVEKNNREKIKKFLNDPKYPVLLVQRSSTKDDTDMVPEGGEGETDGGVSYIISSDVHFTSSKVTSLVFIKKGPVLEGDKSFPSQLQVMNISDGSPYKVLHSYISNAVLPYFKSYIRETGKAERDGDKMAPAVEKKIVDLEMGLLHLQQNSDIPDIILPIHAIVSTVIKKCADEGRKPKVEDFGDQVEDVQFLNALQSGVNRWIREIQKVTKLDRDLGSGTALQEINFWLNLERALLRIQEKLESADIVLTLEILKHGKRFHATVSFDTDTGLKTAMTTVNDYNQLMKDFPLNDLLSATGLDRIRVSLQAIFLHLRKIRPTKYPIQRALRLVEAISRDLSTQLLKVLGTRRLMHIPYEEFEKVISACFDVFSTWDDDYDKLQGLLRDLVKKKREEHLRNVWRVNPAHRRLQGRLDNMRKFRRQHEQLRQVILQVLRPVSSSKALVMSPSEEIVPKLEPVVDEAADANAIEEVHLAYENVKEVDELDVSKEGSDSWEAAIKRYDERIDHVETRITARLRDQLGTAKNANEMFRIFSRFNALFVRPLIRGAIREYQTQLIQLVKDDIELLHEKFKVQYPQSKTCRMSKARDFPSVSGSIIFARQIERQLTAYLRRIEDVLGRGWESHVEGQKLKGDGESFRNKLNTLEVFEEWSRKVTQRQLQVSGRIFTITSVKSRIPGKPNILKLGVNFQKDIITLSKEVRNMKWLGFRVPLAIVNKAHQANQLYPFAMSLFESVHTYQQTLEKLEDRSSIHLLVAGLHKEVRNLVSEGVHMAWESYKLDPYVQKLADTLVNFQEKVDYLLAMEPEIDLEVKSLEMCAYSSTTFREILANVQKVVDNLSLHSFSNLTQWVAKLDEEVEKRLAARLELALDMWNKCLLEAKDKDDTVDHSMDTEASHQLALKLGGKPNIKTFVHELRITNQLIYVSPPSEDARVNIMQELFSWEDIITSLPRIKHSRYQVGLDVESESSATYKNVLTKLPGGMKVVEESYAAIQKIVKELEDYILRNQALWVLNPDSLYNRMGDLATWMRTLKQIKSARKTFDTSETKKEIGPIVVQFGKVQSKVSLKYNSWHKEVLSRFGNMLSNEMTEFHAHIQKLRSDLEQQSIDTANTSEAVGLITQVQSLKRKMKTWEKQVEMYKEGQRILERQRFQFPSNWLYSGNIEGEWGAFADIMKRKDDSIQTQVASLQMKIVAEDKVVEEKTSDLLVDWEKEKPIAGELPPDETLKAITIFEEKFSRLKEERESLAKAKEALELAELAEQNQIVDEQRALRSETERLGLLVQILQTENRETKRKVEQCATKDRVDQLDQDILSNKEGLTQVQSQLVAQNRIMEDLKTTLDQQQPGGLRMVEVVQRVVHLERKVEQCATKDRVDQLDQDILSNKEGLTLVQSQLVAPKSIIEAQKTPLKYIQILKKFHQEPGRATEDGTELQRKVTAHETSLTAINTEMGHLDLSFQIPETTSYNGILLWKIRDYQRRKAEAVAGRTLSLYSQQFFTHRYGYKMCARVYLNGDGMGKGTHLSLFFVVMRGEFDNLLPWPFKQKVTLQLLDQDSGQTNFTHSFMPDVNSSSFRKPTTDMNVASECPLFVAHSVLENPKYVKDDTIILKISVDTVNLRHP